MKNMACEQLCSAFNLKEVPRNNPLSDEFGKNSQGNYPRSSKLWSEENERFSRGEKYPGVMGMN